jgi:hypothetical protein
MSTPALIAIVAVALVIVVVAAWMLMMQRRARLKNQFGPEYERTVRDTGSLRQAESVLDARARRVEKYEIRSLSPEERARFTQSWRQLQTRFIDDPARSVEDADRLVNDLMTTRGYPMADFDRHVEDLSVNYPNVVSHYRDAHAIALRQADQRASTEELRQALVHYRTLFDELLNVPEPREARQAREAMRRGA